VNPRKLIAALALLGLVALLAWSTLSSQRAQCEVCVEFRGRRNCATASAASPPEAVRSAQTTACGTIAQGMDEGIACDRAQPTVARCRDQ
jgi:hypothetical protein